MTVRLHDTLSGDTRPLVPLEPGRVRIYSCGPTVYGPAHIGNFRTFLFCDLLVRFLRWRGYAVTWVMNITDIDDKIIRGAAAAGEGIDVIAERWLERFLADAAALRMTPPDVLPRATEHIPEIVALIQTLIERDHAYRTDDGSIFFRISSWPAYGRLARLDPEGLRVGERVESDEYGKDDVRDFALWKGPKPGEPSWDTAVGPGRPGWHIECSAMSMAHLGPSFDIHTGGVDLVFPHHEDEIAQSEAATGQTFVRTWLHCAHLQTGGEKMAKRVGNIARVSELLDEGVSTRALRYSLIAVHYRAAQPLRGVVVRGRAAMDRLDAARCGARRVFRSGRTTLRCRNASKRHGRRLERRSTMTSTSPPALAVVFDLVRELNRRIERRSCRRPMLAARWRRCATRSVLAVLPDEGAASNPPLRRCSRRAPGPSVARLGGVGSTARRARGPGGDRRGHARWPAVATDEEMSRG